MCKCIKNDFYFFFYITVKFYKKCNMYYQILITYIKIYKIYKIYKINKYIKYSYFKFKNIK